MVVADMTTFKILVNSTLSTPGACWLGLDIKSYYLGTPMDHYEYMFIPINLILLEILDFYNLRTIVHKGKVYAKVCHGMYGLPQSGILAKKQLICFLGHYGYSPYDTLLAFGTTNDSQSASASTWMTSTSNKSAKSMSII